MESNEKAQSETNEDEDQEENPDVLIVPIGFVIRKFIIAARMVYLQSVLRIVAVVQSMGRASQCLEKSKRRNH